jgi:hypothetical protein
MFLIAEHERTVDVGGAEEARGVRAALAAYVAAVHRSWLDTVQDGGADPTTLPLGTRPFAVVVAAARELHVLATRAPLPPVADHEQVVDGHLDGLDWQVRFLDSSVVPELAAAADPDGPDVRDVLGLDTFLYHLTVSVDGALTAHQAVHAGAGLARSHLAHQRGSA